MRCKFCGSKAVFAAEDRSRFSAGKAVAGTLLFGAVGAAAGLDGKKLKGYRCSACGMFSEQTMDSSEEMLINSSITSAKYGNRTVYENYLQKYPNIEAVPAPTMNTPVKAQEEKGPIELKAVEATPNSPVVKHSYSPNQFVVGAPVFISNITIEDNNGTDALVLNMSNISGKTLRSVYLNVSVYDDVGDLINTGSFAIQGLSAETGTAVVQDKPFNLNTNFAYKVQISCEKAAFTDDSVWRKEENPTIHTVPERTMLTPESFAQYKYLRKLAQQRSTHTAPQDLYFPVLEDTHRLCICGNPAARGCVCSACGLTEEALLEIMDYDVLVQCRKDLIASNAKARTEEWVAFRKATAEASYQQACALMEKQSEEGYMAAAKLFDTISDYQDSAQLSKLCLEKESGIRKDRILANAKSKMTDVVLQNYEAALKSLQGVSGWKDADEQIVACQRKIEEIKAKEEADRLDKERKAEAERKEAERIAKRKKKIAIIAAAATCVIIAFIVVLNTVIIPIMKYNDAISLMDAGKYEEAIAAFEAMDGYKDSESKIKECIKEKIKNAKVGDYIRFGKYEQDNNTSNGKEDVEWLVLEVQDGKALVISKYALDCKQYNTSYTGVTWETCTLRKWFNNDFINAAFSADEKAMIPTVTVSADKNPKYSTNPGEATQDQVFLLSITEANKYFSSNSARQCEPTDLAVANGAYVNSSNGNCWWRLRSPGGVQYSAAGVNFFGDVYEGGLYVDCDYTAVRPALWIEFGF